MKRFGLWWVPLLLVIAPIFGRMPMHRDLGDFFVPIREETATRLARGEAPWLNDLNGCGEAWFADPETGVLYPPHWTYLVLPAPWAMSLEVGFHLALLAFGVGLLARWAGAGTEGRLLAEAVAWSSGPVLATVGVINNLETLAWVPWMILAARRRDRRALPLTALAGAMAWLAGEPQVWAVGAVLTVLAASHRRRALAGVVLAMVLVGVQLVPFVFWVLEGDRGGGAAVTYLSGALAPSGWLRTLVPGVPAPGVGSPYVESVFLSAPILLCGLVGLGRRKLWILPIAALALLATLPAVGAGGLYIHLTGALVRYPSRFAILGLAVLIPFVGAGAERWLEGGGRAAGALLGLLAAASMTMTTGLLDLLLGGLTAAGLLIAVFLTEYRQLRRAVLWLGVATCIVSGWSLIGLERIPQPSVGWQNPSGDERTYTPPAPRRILPSILRSPEKRSLWPLGYANLSLGVNLVRTYAPVENRRLAAHLAKADQGPSGAWWLDALAARWAIFAGPAEGPGLAVEDSRQGLRLYRNDRALPVVSLWSSPPAPGTVDLAPGSVTLVSRRPESITVGARSPRPAWLSLSLAPVRGWSWRLDGKPVTWRPGPGLLQVLRIEGGSHRLEGRYRPPALIPGAAVSLLALLGVLGLFPASNAHFSPTSCCDRVDARQCDVS